jgi:nucleoside-diphosphate-sugar epimerase
MSAINAGGARNVASACLEAGVRRLVLISSTVVERQPSAHPFLRHSGLSAMDAYRATRTEAERIASEFAHRGLSLAIVRPKTFVGPGRVSAFNIIFEWIRKGRPVLLMGSASAPYQLVEIRDMAEGIRLLAGSGAEGVFYFGAERFGTLRGDLAALIEHAGTGSRLRFVPPPVARGLLRAMELSGTVTASELHYMSASGRPSVADTSRAVRELGWRPRWSNKEALANAYDWYARSIEENGSAKSIHRLPGPHRAMSRLIETVLR